MNDQITKAHGAGGQDTALLMKRIFAPYFHNEILDRMEDAAIIEAKGSLAFTTDSFVVEPLEFAGGNIGKLSVCGTANDLLMMGAEPRYLTAGFILEEGLKLSTLEQIVASMAETAAQAGISIVAGDTKVAGTGGGMFINTSGIGIVKPERQISAANCHPGDAVIISGNLGDHHACILSARMGIKNTISSDCAVLSPITETLFSNGVRVHAMRDVTRGGLATVLNELADSSCCCIELAETSIPTSEAVKGFCGILGLDPLYMGNEGKLVAVVDKSDAEQALAAMQSCPLGKDAAIIGYVAEGSGVVMNTRLGGKRRLDVLYGEGLPRIC